MSCPGRPAALTLTGAQAGDGPQLPGLIAGQTATAAIADKAYDSDDNRTAIRRLGAEPVIPPRKNRKDRIDYDRHLDKERHAAECHFGEPKQRRRVATRYGKKAANFLGYVWPASIDVMLP